MGAEEMGALCTLLCSWCRDNHRPPISSIHLKEIDYMFPRFAAVGTAAVAAATLAYLIFHFESASKQCCFELRYAYEDLVDKVSISVQKLLGCNALEHPDYHYVMCEGGYTAWKVELLL